MYVLVVGYVSVGIPDGYHAAFPVRLFSIWKANPCSLKHGNDQLRGSRHASCEWWDKPGAGLTIVTSEMSLRYPTRHLHRFMRSTVAMACAQVSILLGCWSSVSERASNTGYYQGNPAGVLCISIN